MIRPNIILFNFFNSKVKQNRIPGVLYLLNHSKTKSWNLLGNSGTIDGTNFIGTTDNVPFSIRVNNQKAGRIDQIKENVLLGNLAGANIPASMSNSLIIGDSAGFGILLDYPETLIIGSGAVSNGNGGGALTVVGSDAGKQNSGFSKQLFFRSKCGCTQYNRKFELFFRIRAGSNYNRTR
jgi:hypothetical protein